MKAKEPNALAGIELAQFNTMDQKRFVELYLRSAKFTLEYGDGESITGRIVWRNDPRCFCVVADDGTWIGIPREDLDQVETVLDLYVNRTVENMRFRLEEALNPRRFAPGEGLDENLHSTVSAETIQQDIAAHSTLRANQYANEYVQKRQTRNTRL